MFWTRIPTPTTNIAVSTRHTTGATHVGRLIAADKLKEYLFKFSFVSIHVRIIIGTHQILWLSENEKFVVQRMFS